MAGNLNSVARVQIDDSRLGDHYRLDARYSHSFPPHLGDFWGQRMTKGRNGGNLQLQGRRILYVGAAAKS